MIVPFSQVSHYLTTSHYCCNQAFAQVCVFYSHFSCANECYGYCNRPTFFFKPNACRISSENSLTKLYPLPMAACDKTL